MKAKFRYARPTNHLKKLSEMYERGLGLQVLGSFEDHQGFDGIILGNESCDYHFEFTHEKGVTAPRAPSAENLMVFYIPDSAEFQITKSRMAAAGFLEVRSHNPYWDDNGCTFEDLEGYRVVLCSRSW